MRLTALLGLGMLAAACAPEAKQPAAPADQTLSAAALDSVKAVDAAFAAGVNAKDTTAIWAVYATDAKLMPPDMPTMEGSAAHPVIAGLLAAGASEMTLTPTLTYGTGDLAYQVGTATFKIGGGTETDKYLEVLRRGSDGKWRYVADMFSGTAAPAAMAPAKKK